MPWTKEDVDEFREGLTDAQKEKWVEIANSVLEDCMEDGGSESECDEKAIRIANSKFEDKGGSVVDLERLDERYVVVRAEGQPAPADVDDLRELEGDFGDGVYPLWSDGRQSIVAWAFEKSLYTDEEAKAWVAEATKEPEGMSAIDLVLVAASAVGRAIAESLGFNRPKFDKDPDDVNAVAVGTESFDDVRRKVESALEEAYAGSVPSPTEAMPWILDIGPKRAIVEVGGDRFAVSYAISDDGEVELGEPEKVDRAWVDGDGSPVTLMAFTTKLQDGSEAEPDEDDGLVWKELIHPGQWHKMDSGRIVEVTGDIVRAAYEAFKAGLPKYVSVPAGAYHPDQVAAEENRGFVAKLKLIGDKLFGGFKFTNPDTKRAVEDGSIADCSVYLEPDVVHPETGEKFGWALTHVLLTNNPLVQDLEPFGAPIPASASGKVKVDLYVQRDEEVNMPEHGDITLSAEDQALLDNAKEMGLTVEDIKAMVEERASVTQKRRDLEVTAVVRALEGKDEHESVTQVEGTRHWPAVIAAAEKALREQPQALAMDVEDGRTDLDEVVLSVVNAIPADARMQLETQPTGSKSHDDPTLEGEEDTDAVKDEKAKRLSQELTPRKGAAVGIG